METTRSRAAILNAIRYSNLFLSKQEVELPQIPVFQRADNTLKPAEFEVHVQ
jgi:hypothetical protein